MSVGRGGRRGSGGRGGRREMRGEKKRRGRNGKEGRGDIHEKTKFPRKKSQLATVCTLQNNPNWLRSVGPL